MFRRNASKTVEWIVMKDGTKICGTQRKNSIDPLMFPLAPPAGQSFLFSQPLLDGLTEYCV